MEVKLFILILISFAFNINMIAQKDYSDKINQLNINGQKEGLWKENINEYWRTEIYYKNGKKNGVYKEFSIARGELSTFGEYKNDTIIGTWYYFGDYGHLMMIQKDFSKNTFPIPSIYQAQGYCPSKCYSIMFYPNGMKKSEGILLWDNNPESDFTFEYGEWKYYDETGKLVRTKEFK